MRVTTFRCMVVLGVAVGLPGCTPGPSYYAAASRDHERQAREHAYLARQNQEAARWQAASGDVRGASLSRDAAESQTRAARWQHLQARKDSWLSW